MSTPVGGAHTGPHRGPVTWRYATFNVRTRVRNNFGHFSRDLGQNCRLVSFSTGTLRGLLTPSGHTFGVIKQPIFFLFFAKIVNIFSHKRGKALFYSNCKKNTITKVTHTIIALLKGLEYTLTFSIMHKKIVIGTKITYSFGSHNTQ